MAIAVGGVGHIMMSWSHKFIPASLSSLSLRAGHVVAIAAAWPLHDEPVTLPQVLGAVGAVVSRPATVTPVEPLVGYE